VQLILTDEGATALEEVLDDALFQLRAQIAQAGTDVDKARLERKATFIRKILQQLATRGLSHII
jgi:uncharacterized protein involved in exopolysaccharide biosynthesis